VVNIETTLNYYSSTTLAPDHLCERAVLLAIAMG